VAAAAVHGDMRCTFSDDDSCEVMMTFAAMHGCTRLCTAHRRYCLCFGDVDRISGDYTSRWSHA
jgi:hypothetical protein